MAKLPTDEKQGGDCVNDVSEVHRWPINIAIP